MTPPALDMPVTEWLANAAAIVRERTGLVFGDARRGAFASALVTAMRRAGVGDPHAYAARLTANPELLDELVDEITVGETYFFREPQQFATIRDTILPAMLVNRPRDHPLRVWSAGCASGEEAYSLAILLHGYEQDRHAHIIGTDISRDALRKAARAQYTSWSLRGVPDAVRQTYFRPVGHQFHLAPAIRRAVEFRQLNLAGEDYPSTRSGIGGMDLILCRNVLIYFDAATVARVARKLIESLSPRGWLILGPSDPLLADLVPCEIVITGAGLAYRPADVGRPATTSLLPAPTRPSWPPIEAFPEAPIPATALPSVCVANAEASETVDDDLALAQSVRSVREIANRGDADTAWRASAAALERHPGAAELVYIQAALLSEAERYVESATTARRALYLDRGLVVAHMALGGALTHTDDVDGARRAFRNAERLLLALPPDTIVPASDGEPAGRLTKMARAQLAFLSHPAS